MSVNRIPAILDPFAHLHEEGYEKLYAQPRIGQHTLVSLGGRTGMSLNGPWNFTLDQFDEGLRQKWFADTPAPAESWVKPRDYDAGQGGALDVPSCWTMQHPQWRHFEGSAWYTRVVHHSPDAARPRVLLHVGAANYLARVFLNGRFLGVHRGGSTPFSVELTDGLVPGDNRLQIQVNNERAADRVPMRHFDWFNHGGIYRDVQLLKLPAVFIRDACVQLKADGTLSTVTADVTLSNAVDGTAVLEIAELGVVEPLQVRRGRCSVELACRPELWSPEHPRLYDVRIAFGDDVWTERVGFREIRAQGCQLLLNGQALYLRGICVHEDDIELGKVSTESDVRRRLADARALGCNFMRLSHYPHHEHVARLADEVGMLLWEEVPVYWAIQFGNPDTLADARNQLQELIQRDRNRASVILWGVGNENEDSDARLAFMRELAESARAADPTRLIGAACLINRVYFRIEDRLAEHVDVIGINEYFGWYEPEFDGLDLLLANSRPDKPVLISETGADALAGHHGAPTELYTEENQARFLREQMARIANVPYICGITPWLLYDFRSERRQTVFNQGFNRKGLIAEDKKTRKLGFEVLAGHYRKLAAASR